LTVKRRYLTEREVDRLMDCARKYGRYGHRDATMILVAYRHGLRASEVCDLQWQQIELSESRLHVPRYTGLAALPRPPEHTVQYTEMAPDRGLLERLTLGLGHLGAVASGRRQARDDFRFPLDHLGVCPCFPLSDQFPNNLNPSL